jgi:Domain of unknown function (DUF4331)
LGDQRLDLCDLDAFQSPADPTRTVLILNANPNADALHPDAIYRLAIDNDGDLQNDIAFSYVFSTPRDGRQTVDVFLASGEQAESPEAVGEKIFDTVEVSFGRTPTSPNPVNSPSSRVRVAMRSSSTSTASRTCSTPRAPETSRHHTWRNSAGNRHGRGRTRTRLPTSFPPFSNRRRRIWARIPTSGYGEDAVCAVAAGSNMWIAQGTRR